MKIALIQPDVILNRIEENGRRIGAMCSTAFDSGASVCVAPFEVFAGPVDISERKKKEFIFACEKAVNALAEEMNPCGMILTALPLKTVTPVVVTKGQVSRNVSLFQIDKMRIHCEASRFCNIFFKKELATNELPNIFVNLASRPYAPESQLKTEEIVLGQAMLTGGMVLAPNLAGGYGEIVYNGQSVAACASKGIIARGQAFQEDIVMVELAAKKNQSLAPVLDFNQSQWDALVCGTRDFVCKAGARSVILGLSGGMDSALVACIASDALGPANVLGILMPSPFSSRGSVEDALALAENLGIQTRIIPIEPMMKAFKESLWESLQSFSLPASDMTFENLQARIRGTILMALANRSGGLVLNTGNKSEIMMGYCTLYGDAVGALAVIGDLYKTRVYALAEWYNRYKGWEVIPQKIILKEPSAELAPNQKDTDSLPPYAELDPILCGLERGNWPSARKELDKWRRIEARMLANKFKLRQLPPALRVG